MEPEKFFEAKNPHFDWSSASVAAVSSPSSEWVSEYWNGIALTSPHQDPHDHEDPVSSSAHFTASLSPPRQPLPRLISRDIQPPDPSSQGIPSKQRPHSEIWPPLEAFRRLSVTHSDHPIRPGLSVGSEDRAAMSDVSSLYNDLYGPLKTSFRPFDDPSYLRGGSNSSRRAPSLHAPLLPAPNTPDHHHHHMDPLTSFAFGSHLAPQKDPMLVPDPQSPWSSSPPSYPLSFGLLSSNRSHASSLEDAAVLRRHALLHHRRRSFSSASISPQGSANGMVRPPSSSGSSARVRLQQFYHHSHRHHHTSSSAPVYSSPILEDSIKALGGQKFGFTQTTRSVEGVSALRQLTTSEIKQLQLVQYQQALDDVRLVALLLSGYLARRPEFNTSRRRRHQLNQLARLAHQRIPIEHLERLHSVLLQCIAEAKKWNPMQRLLSGLKEISQLLRVSESSSGLMDPREPSSDAGPLAPALSPPPSSLEGSVSVDSRAAVSRLSAAINLYMSTVPPEERSQMSISHAISALSETLENISSRSDSAQALHSESQLMASLDELCNLLEQNARIRQAQQVQERNTHVAITNVLNLISQEGGGGGGGGGDSFRQQQQQPLTEELGIGVTPPIQTRAWPGYDGPEAGEEKLSPTVGSPLTRAPGAVPPEEEEASNETTQPRPPTSSRRTKRASSKNTVHQCHICKKTFSMALGLKRHMRNHTGEKPFQCEICGARFSQKSSCKRHLRIHTGARPYKCPICGRGFAQRSNQQRHMKTHARKPKK